MKTYSLILLAILLTFSNARQQTQQDHQIYQPFSDVPTPPPQETKDQQENTHEPQQEEEE